MAEEIKLTLDLDLTKYDRAMQDAERKGVRLDRTLKGIGDAIALDLDASALDKAEAKFKGLDGAKASVDVQADTSQLDRAAGDVAALDGAKATVGVEVDQSSLDGMIGKITGALGAIAVGGAVVGGAAVIGADAADQSAAVGQFALATGQTREAADAVGSVINDVWVSGFAESRTEIAGVAAQLYNAGLRGEELGEATRDAFVLARQSGEDMTAIIRAQSALVRSDLVGSYDEASDVLASGFGEGLNGAQDLLDTVIEYSRDFGDLGVTAQEFFSILDSGLESGAYNTDKIADAFRELKIRVDTALTARTGTEFEGLKTLGLLDEAEAFRAGELTGQQWVTAVLQEVEGGNLDALVTGAFGSPIEDLGLSVFEAIDEAFGNPELTMTFQGTVDRAAAIIEDTLPFAFGRAGRAITTDLTNSIMAGISPVNNLLDTLPDRLNEFADLIQSGAGIPEALAIVLEAPQLSGILRDLQATVGGFIIDFQIGLASVLDAFGQDETAAGIQANARTQAVAQLEFDLVFGDRSSADIAHAVTTALRRGVSDVSILEASTDAATEIAQTFGVDFAREFAASAANVQIGDTAFGTVVAIGAREGLETALAEEQAATEAAIAAAIEPALSGGYSAALDNVLAMEAGEAQQAAVTALTDIFNDALAAVDPSADAVTFAELVGLDETGRLDLLGAVDESGRFVGEFINEVVADYRTATGDIGGSLETISTTAADVGQSAADGLQPITDRLAELNQDIYNVNESLLALYANAGLPVGSGIPIIPNTGGGGGGNSTTVTTNNTANVTINTTGTAQSAAAGSGAARAVRGF